MWVSWFWSWSRTNGHPFCWCLPVDLALSFLDSFLDGGLGEVGGVFAIAPFPSALGGFETVDTLPRDILPSSWLSA